MHIHSNIGDGDGDMASVSVSVSPPVGADRRSRRRRPADAPVTGSVALVLAPVLLLLPTILSCSAFQTRRQSMVALRRQRAPFLEHTGSSLASQRLDSVRSVEWCGAGGMLPLQRYSGTMNDYEQWLRRPLDDGKADGAAAELSANDVSLPATATDASLTAEERRKRQRKLDAQVRASRPLNPRLHLRPIYIDAHIVVVSKSSGVMSVPGPRRNPSVANLVHTYLGNDSDDVDRMVAHRLDLDTSGVVVYARTDLALSRLHDAFRYRNVRKKYQALLCGHLLVEEGEIDLLLRRDRHNPPFMCVSTDEDEEKEKEAEEAVVATGGNVTDVHRHAGYLRMIGKKPKPSVTTFQVLSYERMDGLPVTRVELVPQTGRTHQLRVHCAAIGHPIVGDDIYGFGGEGSPNGGLPDAFMDGAFPRRATWELQKEIDEIVQRRRKRDGGGGEADGTSTGGGGITQPGGTGNLCLHARELCFLHPMSNAPLIFEADVPF